MRVRVHWMHFQCFSSLAKLRQRGDEIMRAGKCVTTWRKLELLSRSPPSKSPHPGEWELASLWVGGMSCSDDDDGFWEWMLGWDWWWSGDDNEGVGEFVPLLWFFFLLIKQKFSIRNGLISIICSISGLKKAMKLYFVFLELRVYGTQPIELLPICIGKRFHAKFSSK